MVTSTSNPLVKNLVALGKQPKERRRQGVFLVEGVRMCREIPKGWLRGLYVSESFIEGGGHAAALEGREHTVLSDRAFAAASGTKTPQGIMAAVKRPEYEFDDLLCGEKTLLLILEKIQDPGNLGTMFRAGEGAGVTGIIMDRETVDIFSPKTVRSTMGSIFRVPYFVADGLPAVLAELKGRGIALHAAHLGGAVSYDEPDYRGPCGFLIGNEAQGLSDALADMADEKIYIPMAGQVESLNAAVSASVLLYECSRQRRKNKFIK
ncbi:MAG: RNA methyltransferase [Clostridiales bacterium]|nr:RNA methyltransferase [Clostridiales bacterium]